MPADNSNATQDATVVGSRDAIIRELREFISRSDYCQEASRELARLLPQDDALLDEVIGEVAASNNQLEFVFVVMAALAAGRPVQGRHLAMATHLMPEKHTMGAVAMHMQGDIGGPLLDAVTNLNLPSAELVAVALYLAATWYQKNGGELPARLISAARRATRDKRNTNYEFALLQTIAVMSGEAGLNALVLERTGIKADDPKLKEIQQAAMKVGEQFLQIWRRPPIELVPAAPRRTLAEGNTMRRAVERVGRNEPCPCGSGKKYKHCCIEKDRERLHHSTSIAGVTEAELRANRERYVTGLELDSMPGHEAAQLDPLKLAEGVWDNYFANLCRARLLDKCVEAFEKLGYNEKLDSPFHNVLIRIAQFRRKDLVDRMLKLPPDKSKIRAGALELFLGEEDPVRTLEMFQNESLLIVSHHEFERMHGFSRTLLNSSLCAFGILVARGMIPLLPPDQAASLLEELLLARDKLYLSPDDPISDVLDKQAVEQRDEGKDAVALREAQARLRAKMQEVQQYRESVDRLERELARRAKTPETHAAPVVQPEDAAVREMREKVNALKELLKERHNERNQLRRELQKTQADLESLRQKNAEPAIRGDGRAEKDDEEDLLLPQDADGNQPLRLVEFPRNFQQTLGGLPRHVARGALAMLGRLAGGEPAAFVGAVRLKACPSITRQRIGIDHRLLFKLLPDRVQVVDLIPRQDLERRIKTLI
jgi:hypothetical protein